MNNPSAPAQNAQSTRVDPQLLSGLKLLLQAHQCALQTQCSRWEFALEIQALAAAGLTNNSLRSLLYDRCIEHGVEAGACSRKRSVRATSELRMTADSCFILTTKGIELARRLTDGQAGTKGADIPQWLGERWELHFCGCLVKKFARLAANQSAVLDAFEKHGWPHRIDSPLHSDLKGDGTERLHDTIKRLNRHQQNRLLHFRRDGTGDGVAWEPVA